MFVHSDSRLRLLRIRSIRPKLDRQALSMFSFVMFSMDKFASIFSMPQQCDIVRFFSSAFRLIKREKQSKHHRKLSRAR